MKRYKLQRKIFALTLITGLMFLFRLNFNVYADQIEINGLNASDAKIVSPQVTGQVSDIEYTWSVPSNVNIKNGDTATFTLPVGFKAEGRQGGSCQGTIKTDDGTEVGTVSINSGSSTGIITFNAVLNNKANCHGTLQLWAVKEADGNNLQSSSSLGPITKFGAIVKDSLVVSAYSAEPSLFQTTPSAGYEMIWRVLINPSGQSLKNVEITDNHNGAPNVFRVSAYQASVNGNLITQSSTPVQCTSNVDYDTGEATFNLGDITTPVILMYSTSAFKTDTADINVYNNSATIISNGTVLGSTSAQVGYGVTGTAAYSGVIPSSLSESITSSKISSSSKATTSSKISSSSKATTSSKISSSSKATTSSKILSSSKAITSSKISSSSKATTSSKISSSSKSSTSSKISSSSKATTSSKVSSSSKATTSSKISSSSKSLTSSKISSSSKAITSSKISSSSKSLTSSKISSSSKSLTSSKISSSSKAITSSKISSSSKATTNSKILGLNETPIRSNNLSLNEKSVVNGNPDLNKESLKNTTESLSRGSVVNNNVNEPIKNNGLSQDEKPTANDNIDLNNKPLKSGNSLNKGSVENINVGNEEPMKNSGSSLNEKPMLNGNANLNKESLRNSSSNLSKELVVNNNGSLSKESVKGSSLNLRKKLASDKVNKNNNGKYGNKLPQTGEMMIPIILMIGTGIVVILGVVIFERKF